MSAVLCNRHTFFGNELPLHFMTQENKRSFHYNCITSNGHSSCNETSDIRPLGRLSFPSNVAHIKLVNHWKRTGRRPGRPATVSAPSWCIFLGRDPVILGKQLKG